MNQPQLTIEQALQTIDSICAQFKGTRDEHILIVNSLNLIKQELTNAKHQNAEKNEIVNHNN